MGKRPKINIVLTKADKIIEMVSWIALFALWIFTLINFTNVPDTIPIHFNFAGEADNFGSKYNIIALPMVATTLFIGLTVLNKFPHAFNYPTPITTDNAIKLYTNATRLIRMLKLIIVIVFGLIAIQTISAVTEKTNSLGTWFLPLSMGMIFVPILYFLIRSFNTKSH
jgi:uncharacterized membrane protein